MLVCQCDIICIYNLNIYLYQRGKIAFCCKHDHIVWCMNLSAPKNIIFQISNLSSLSALRTCVHYWHQPSLCSLSGLCTVYTTINTNPIYPLGTYYFTINHKSNLSSGNILHNYLTQTQFILWEFHLQCSLQVVHNLVAHLGGKGEQMHLGSRRIETHLANIA